MKALLTPVSVLYRQYVKGKSEGHKLNPYLVSKINPKQCGFNKASVYINKSTYSLEFENGKQQLLLNIRLQDIRKILLSEETKKVKRPYTPGFVFELSILLGNHKRIDLLTSEHKAFSVLTESLHASTQVRELLTKLTIKEGYN